MNGFVGQGAFAWAQRDMIPRVPFSQFYAHFAHIHLTFHVIESQQACQSSLSNEKQLLVYSPPYIDAQGGGTSLAIRDAIAMLNDHGEDWVKAVTALTKGLHSMSNVEFVATRDRCETILLMLVARFLTTVVSAGSTTL